jgi:hypothetical protein
MTMNATQTQVETFDADVETSPETGSDSMTELQDLELALVGGGAGDVYF